MEGLVRVCGMRRQVEMVYPQLTKVGMGAVA